MNFRKFRKSAKALSPVIATIILIAVTVAVSVVVAAWMGALTIGFMGNSEQAKITNVVLTNTYDPATSSLTTGTTTAAVVTIQNTGSAAVTISSATIDGNSATLVHGYPSGTIAGDLLNGKGQIPIAKGTSVDVAISITTETFSNSAQYTITLMTAKGNTLTSSAAYNGS